MMYSGWPPVARLARERTTFRKHEHWHVEYVHNCPEAGTSTLHPTWAGTPFLTCGALLFPGKNWILMDTDAAPTALYDVADLADMHHDNKAPGMSVISEGANPINAGIVTIHRQHNRATERVECKFLDDMIWHRLLELVVHASPGKPGEQAPASETDWEAKYIPLSDWQRLAQEKVSEKCPLHGIKAAYPSDYCVVWSFLCMTRSFLGFEKVPDPRTGVLKWGRAGCADKLDPILQGLHPRFQAWARGQFEQGSLTALRAMSSSASQFVDLPGCCFMLSQLPTPSAGAVPFDAET